MIKKNDLARLLYISRPTLDKYLKTYEAELKEYTTYINGRFAYFDEAGLDTLRSLCKTPPKELSNDKQLQNLRSKIKELEEKISNLEKEKTELLEQITSLKNDKENLILDKQNLIIDKEDLKERLGSVEKHFIVRLLGWTKR